MNSEQESANKILIFLASVKYKMLLCFCIFTHVVFLVYSLINSVDALAIFNVFSVTLYVVLLLFVEKRSTLITFIISYGEIAVHAFFATLMLGQEFGFSFYFLVLVPMSFNLLHTPEVKQYRGISILLAVFSFCMFSCSYTVSFYTDPIYDATAFRETIPLIYMMNIFVAFFNCAFFSVLFAYDVDTAMGKLYSKNRELNVLANRDALTGLYNRRTMTGHVANMYEDYQTTETPFSLVIGDIDDFKKVNDSLGHDCGDLVLKTVAKVLRSLTRDNDFICRWGGEEFLILLKNAEKSQAHRIAERFRERISESEVRYKDVVLSVTMTFGVSCANESKSYEDLFRLADHRLYEGKSNGKNQVV